MKKIIRFWQADLVNKLILLVSLALVSGVLAMLFLLLNLPGEKTLARRLGEYFPSPTLEPRLVLTQISEKALTRVARANLNLPASLTPRPITAVPASPTATQVIRPTATALPPTATSLPAATPTVPPAGPVTASVTEAACLPAKTPQTGKVLDVLDATTLKVQIEGLAYVVRYLGVEPPTNQNYAVLAAQTNGQLVFAKEVTLIADQTDRDASGRYLRYVIVDGTLVNLALLQKGLATSPVTEPGFACAGLFISAEQTARAAGVGLWEPLPTPPTP